MMKQECSRRTVRGDRAKAASLRALVTPGATRAASMLGAAIIGAICLSSAVGCTEHRYRIDVETDGHAIERSLQIKSVTGSMNPSDAEVARLIACYNRPTPGSHSESGSATGRDTASANFRGRFEGRVPNDLGGWGEVTRCESPLGRVAFYHELLRPTIDLAAHLQRSSRALDTLVDVTLEVFGEEYGKDPAWPSLAAVVDGPVRADLHHFQTCGWSVVIAKSLEPTLAAPAASGQEGTLTGNLPQQDWWKAELAQRGYLAPGEATVLLLDKELPVAADGLVFLRAIERKCVVENQPAAAELLGRIRDALSADSTSSHTRSQGHEQDPEPLSARLSARASKAILARWPELAATQDPSKGSDADPGEDIAMSLMAMALPDGAVLAAWDDVEMHVTLPGVIVATNGEVVGSPHDPSEAPKSAPPGEASPPPADAKGPVQSEVRWTSKIVAHPDQPGRVGMRVWAIAAEPNEEEQRRLWGAVRLTGEDLALLTAQYASLSPAAAAELREAIEASRQETTWRAWMAQRRQPASINEAEPKVIEECVQLLERVLFTRG
jgi:hypothetical protein